MAAGSPSSHDWQRTVVKSETVTFTWNVEGFDSLRKLARLKALPSKDRLFSPEFGTETAGHWKVALFPYGDRETQRFVSLYLFGDKLQKRVAEFSMVVLDKDFREIPDTFLGEEPTFFTPESSSWGWHEFLSVENDDELRGFLVNENCLRVKIMVKVYIGVVDDESPRLLFNIVQHRCEHSDDDFSDSGSSDCGTEIYQIEDAATLHRESLRLGEKPTAATPFLTHEKVTPESFVATESLQRHSAVQRYNRSASTSRLTRAGTFAERSPSHVELASVAPGPNSIDETKPLGQYGLKTLPASSVGPIVPMASSRSSGLSSGSAAPNATNTSSATLRLFSPVPTATSTSTAQMPPEALANHRLQPIPPSLKHSRSLVVVSSTIGGPSVASASKSAAASDMTRTVAFKAISGTSSGSKTANRARRRKSYCCCSASNAAAMINGEPFTGTAPSNRKNSDQKTSLNIRGQALQVDVAEFASDARIHDVMIRSGNKCVPAVRFLLAARSVVLREMLFGSFVEQGQQEVELSDVLPEALEDFVTFLMTDACPPLVLPFNCRCGCGRSKFEASALGKSEKGERGAVCKSVNCTGCVKPKDAMPVVPRLLTLLVAADKYQIEELRSRCIQSLARCICAATVLEIYDHAEKLRCDALGDACKFYLRSNSAKLANVVDHMRKQRRRSSLSTTTSSVGIGSQDVQLQSLLACSNNSTAPLLASDSSGAAGNLVPSKVICDISDLNHYQMAASGATVPFDGLQPHLLQSRWMNPTSASLSMSSMSFPSDAELPLPAPAGQPSAVSSLLNGGGPSLPSCSGLNDLQYQ